MRDGERLIHGEWSLETALQAEALSFSGMKGSISFILNIHPSYVPDAESV